MGNILNPKQYCFAIRAARGSIRNPKQYCFAISAAMGSILNLKQLRHQQHHYPQGVDKLDAWGIPLEMAMSNFDGKDFWTWQENVPTVEPTCREYDWSSSLIKGKWKSYWGLQLGFCFVFFWYELWSLLVSRGRAQYLSIYLIYLFISLFIIFFKFIYLSIYVFVCLFIYLSIYLFICLFIYIFIYATCSLARRPPRGCRRNWRKQHELKISSFPLLCKYWTGRSASAGVWARLVLLLHWRGGGVFPFPPEIRLPQAHLQSNNETKGNKSNKNNNSLTQDKNFNVNFMTQDVLPRTLILIPTPTQAKIFKANSTT